MTEDSFFTGWEKVIKATPKGNARSSGYVRNSHDWHQESAASVDALLDVERFDGVVWDPACGSYNIPDRCVARGLEAVGSDILDRSGRGFLVDFFATDHLLAPFIVTNPPFVYAQRFVEHALKLGAAKVAIIQRLAFLEGQERGKMFRATPPARVWVFSSRQSMPPGGMDVPAQNRSTAYAWLVWDAATPTMLGETRMNWLP